MQFTSNEGMSNDALIHECENDHLYMHLCMQFRTDGIKEMSSGLSRGKQVTKFANSGNCG